MTPESQITMVELLQLDPAMVGRQIAAAERFAVVEPSGDATAGLRLIFTDGTWLDIIATLGGVGVFQRGEISHPPPSAPPDA